MANRDPWQARMKRWQKLWPVPIAEIQAQAYGVLMMAYEGVAVEDVEQRRKNILAYFQGLTALNRLLQGDTEARLQAIERRLESHGKPL